MKRPAITALKVSVFKPAARGTKDIPIWVVVLFSFLLTSVAIPSSGLAQTQDDKITWLTGREFEKTLELAVSAELTGSKIRDALYEFAKRKKMGVFVDRRVDSELRLNLSLIDLTVEQYLLQVAEAHDLGMARIGEIFYVGPSKTANEFSILIEESEAKRKSKTPPVDVVKWREKEKMTWPELSQPRKILLELAAKNNFKVVNPELIPHDLWPAVQLPNSTLESRVAMLLVGFNLWFKSSGKGHIKIVNWPELEKGTRVVRNVSDAREVARRLRTSYGDCKFVDKGKSLKITGPVDQVGIAVREVMDLRDPNRGDPSLQRFTLDTTAKRIQILKKIARQMKLQLVVSDRLDKEMEERVTIKVSQQPADAIIKAVLKGSGARSRVVGERMLISK